MSDSTEAINLRQLDDAPAATLAPGIWAANLAALQLQNPSLASSLEQVSLPDNWRPVVGLDGFVTWRTEAAGRPPVWLAGTAAPLKRAEALLSTYHVGDLNATLPSIAAAAEVWLLLRRLPAHKAVYVFERDLLALRAVLHSVDLAADLSAGRCILVPPGDEHPFLDGLLARCPGLFPPGNILCPPEVNAEHLHRVRGTCEQACRETGLVRRRKLDQLAAAAAEYVRAQKCRPVSARPRLAVLALNPSRLVLTTADALLAGAQALAWPARGCLVRGPRDADVLAHCEALAEFNPELTVCVNHNAALLPLSIGGTVCEWYLHAADVPDQLSNAKVLRLASSPRVAEALRAAGATARSVVEFWWAGAPAPAEPVPGEPLAGPVIVADLPDDDAKSCGVEQPTHKRLWEHLRTTAAQWWERREIAHPEALLAHCERASGIRIGEPAVRAQLRRIVEHVLIPAAVLRRIVSTVAGESPTVFAIGTGWKRSSANLTILGSHTGELPGDIGPPTAAIFADCFAPLSPALLWAAQRGWPLLLYSPGGASRVAPLDGVLHPDQHYQVFSRATDLRGALRLMESRPESVARRNARARAHVSANHTYRHRLEDLARFISNRLPRPSVAERQP
ncbi:MAG: glycosyltransferase [Planctomycetes bacterium]|nr:glycosyltransferase [Planctomycetota bacterium]